MYHPSSEDVAEEYIELWNNGAGAVDLSGWQLTSGVGFTFPAGTTLAAGGYLVVAANGAAFSAKYPGVTNFVAGWNGRLSNSGNTVTLADASAVEVDRVSYSDDGDWAERQRDQLADHGHRGWGWHSDADGFGKSLELINAAFDDNEGQNWAASATAEGTPGAANSRAAADLAPVIDRANHFPLVPKSGENVTVTCRVRDDHAAPLTVALHFRNDGAATFATAAMFDDGAHGDAAAGDGVFGAVIPAKTNGTIVEFYFTASDGALARSWPAPARDFDGTLGQTQNCFYQVDDTSYAGAMPIYRMVLRAADRTELSNINRNATAPPFAYNAGEIEDQTYSHARFNTTWITHDGTGDSIVYLAGVRNRGNGSRSASPQSFNVAFRNSDPWKGVTALNLNTQNTPYQLIGSAIFRKAGLTMAETRAVQVRVNGTNNAGSGAPSYGFYVANEVLNSEFTDHHFPLDSSGNIYRGLRQDLVGGANLRDQSGGEPAATADPAPYRVNYFKQTNASEDRWADLIGLTKTLAKGTSDAATYTAAYSADYVRAVQAAGDTAEWERFFAAHNIADNTETNLSNGDGDDYNLYFGINDPRAVFIPYDLDTIFGAEASTRSATHSLFRPARANLTGNPPTPLHSFLIHPQFAREYLAEVKRQIDGPFSAAQFAELANETLGGLVNASVIDGMQTFHNARLAYLASVLPLSLSGISATSDDGTVLPTVNGYPQATAATFSLRGKADCTRTASVKVNGGVAIYTPWKVTNVGSFTTSIGDWQATSVALQPGLNRVLVQAFDAADAEIERSYFSVWFEDGSVTSVSGALSVNTTWTAEDGPYQVTSALTVSSGATLTIAPGTTIYFASGVGLTVAAGGQLLAEGTEAQPIRFSRAPGSTGNGGSIVVNGQPGAPETRFVHAFFEFGGDPAVLANANSDLVLDYCEWARTDVAYLHLDGGSFLVSHCIFPAPSTAIEGVHGTIGIPAGGRGIVRDSFFGRTNGYNDVVDYTGGNRPAPIVQFINNVFIGSDDDVLDLDGTDAWVEGNIFMHVHRNGSPDSASAVSGGSDSGNTSQVTIVGNLFYDVDQAITAKQGNFFTVLQNTIVDQNGRGSGDAVTGALNFADTGIQEAAGMYVEGNIFESATALVRNYPGSSLASNVTFNNNILPPGQTWNGLGSGNRSVDPRLTDLRIVDPSAVSGGADNLPTPSARDYERVAAEIRAQLAPGLGSPAKGTGPNGSDLGGVRPLGVTLGGAPVGTTNATSASITIGTRLSGNSIPSAAGTFPNGSGWTHYQWRLNGGAWSPETVNTAPLTLTGLANGPQVLEVIGKNDAGFYQNDPAFGEDARVSSVAWNVDSGFVPPADMSLVQISEVLAKNVETLGFSGSFPDLIELRNAGRASADLSGWGLSENAALPYKYMLPNGTTLAPGARLVIYASNATTVPEPRTGFGLKESGDTLTLTKSAAAGGGIADSVAFGAQIADASIGRRESDGGWDLCLPSFGAANVVAAQAEPDRVRINEWLANAVALFPQDFIELINTAALPVNVGGCYLSDNPVEWPQHDRLRQLTFIAPGGFLYLKADSDPGQGPDHLNFKLASEQGEIGFSDSALNLVDSVVYGPQTSDLSQGRTPNGANTIAFFNQPTPGAPNPGVTGVTVQTASLVPATQAWRYRSSGVDFSATFFAPDFDDSAWTNAAQLLFNETAPLTNSEGFVKTTALPANANNSNRPFNATYFRTHFTYDGPLTGVTLRAKVMIDDGAIFYLNGKEILPANLAGRLRMPTGAIRAASIATAVIDNAVVENLTFVNAPLQSGDNVLCVEVHQNHSGTTQTSPDAVFGMKLDAETTTGAAASALVINEVLPLNATFQNPDGSYAGWVELYNAGDSALDVSDMSFSDELGAPRKFVFPAGASVPGGGYLVTYFNALAPASATNTGFALPALGGGVYFFEKPAVGGGLHDSVNYGLQIPDFAIGRTPNGSGPFALTVPTRGALNSAAGLGAISSVRLNEWLANPSASAGFLELYNTSASPVAIGGDFLTNVLTNKTKSPLPALSFIGGSGPARWRAFIADGVTSPKPGHVNFALNPSGESLGLFSGTGVQIDAVSFGPQTRDVAQGHFPDGTGALAALTPTPGSANEQASADSDNDGLSDAWEMANFGNLSATSDGDPDGDGQSNKAEFLAGTSPTDPASRLQVRVVPDTYGQAHLLFIAQANTSYTVQYKDALGDASWQKAADVTAQAATRSIDLAVGMGSGEQRFYRVITPGQP